MSGPLYPLPVLADFSRESYAHGVADERARIRQALEELDMNRHYRITCEPPSPVDWSQHGRCDLLSDLLSIIDGGKA